MVILSYSTLINLRLKFVELKSDLVDASKLTFIACINPIGSILLNTEGVSSEIYKET